MPCRRPVRSHAGSRRGRRRSRCPASTTSAATSNAAKATKAAGALGSRQRQQHDRSQQQELRQQKPAAAAAERACEERDVAARRRRETRTISAYRACRPGRTARWCRDRRRLRASRSGASIPTVTAAGRTKSRGTARSERGAVIDGKATSRQEEGASAGGEGACDALPGRSCRGVSRFWLAMWGEEKATPRPVACAPAETARACRT